MDRPCFIAGCQALGDGGRHMLQAPASAPAPSTDLTLAPANLYTLSATDAISLLCARNITAVQYVQVRPAHVVHDVCPAPAGADAVTLIRSAAAKTSSRVESRDCWLLQALLDHLNGGGWSCINAFIGFNSTRVSPLVHCSASTRVYCMSGLARDPILSSLPTTKSAFFSITHVSTFYNNISSFTCDGPFAMKEAPHGSCSCS